MRRTDRDPAWLLGCSQPKYKIWPWLQGDIRPTQTQGPLWNHCLVLLKLFQVMENKDETKELWRCDSYLHAILDQNFYFCFMTAGRCWLGLWGAELMAFTWVQLLSILGVFLLGSLRWNVEDFKTFLFSFCSLVSNCGTSVQHCTLIPSLKLKQVT